MTARYVTIAGFVLFAVVGVALEMSSRGERARVPSLGDVFAWISAAAPGRVGIMLVWWWTGWHFFAR